MRELDSTLHVLMRDEKEGRKKQARSNKHYSSRPRVTKFCKSLDAVANLYMYCMCVFMHVLVYMCVCVCVCVVFEERVKRGGGRWSQLLLSPSPSTHISHSVSPQLA